MNLRIPGPTPCPDEILEAMGYQMVNHRGPEFQDMLWRITDRLKTIFQTKNDVLILTGSGTGAMEASIVNMLSPGDKVIAVSIGVFGDRLADIAESYGASVVRLKSELGQAIDPQSIRESITQNPDVKAVLVTHNETSTGVTNDMATISSVVKEFDILLIVDAISSLSSLPFYMDNWGCDVVMSGSQKGYMVPPGLAFVGVSDNAWKAFKNATMPRFYWDFGKAKNYLERGQTPWTPAISIFYGLDVALEMMLTEGLENIYARHATIGEQTRDGIVALGLSLFANRSCASNTVTSVHVPNGIDPKQLLSILQNDQGVVLSGGQGSLTGKIFRVGHLGYVSETDISMVIHALGSTLPRVGFEVKDASLRGV